jgi:hypothetical protein
MSGGAGPVIFLRTYCEAGFDGIPLDVPYRVQKVVRIERRAPISTLPEMADCRSHPVDSLRVLAVNRLQATAHAVRTRRYDDQVDVVWHETVREHAKALASPIGVE